MLVAQAAEPGEVALGWGVHAAGALHGLDDDGGDLVPAFGHARGDRLEVVGGKVHHPLDERPVAVAVDGDPLGREPAVGHSVVGA